MSKIPLLEKSIVFIGFMGVGKTTVGELVAKKLGRNFIDTDQEIEKEFQMSTQEIFDKFGEVCFRSKEAEMVLKFCSQKLNVISVGGGAFLQNEIRDNCLTNCIVFNLDSSWEYWEKERLSMIIETRPKLQNLTKEEIRELFLRRKALYSMCHSKFKIDNFSADEASNFIIKLLSDYIMESTREFSDFGETPL